MHCCENRFWKDGTATVRIYNLARIAGVNLPTHKRVPIALTYITGIGPASADKICEGTKIDAARRINEFQTLKCYQSANLLTQTLMLKAIYAGKFP